ncbi:ABC transporter ATP-binding protein [Paenibacillus massiliensis]|uniref:ABC transporter ATP-binding protein n=1 Tax=Paenibacillus massiliensis TaxID=225917 RepID=UPI000471860D|nr:ABC transporter ATP-binding protein [Paenibacillus massiliensis]
MKAIDIKELVVERGGFRLKDIEALFPQGQMTAIVGPNGSGKSTLLKAVTRLLRIQQGQIRIMEQPADTLSPRQFATLVAMLPQSREGFPDLTVKELVAYGRSPHKRLLSRRLNSDDEEAVQEAMAATGVLAYADRLIHTLSGGEQQKTRIAMALAQQTDILLLDEPTTYLDMAHQLDLMNMLTDLNRKRKLTIVMVLHDLQQAAAYCDYMIAMKRGSIVADGEPSTLLTADFLRQVYELEARVTFMDGYPLIIPNTGLHHRR